MKLKLLNMKTKNKIIIHLLLLFLLVYIINYLYDNIITKFYLCKIYIIKI